MNRDALLDKLFKLIERIQADFGVAYQPQIEDILYANNANPDDSDPEEGFASTMSDDDIKKAYSEISGLMKQYADTVEKCKECAYLLSEIVSELWESNGLEGYLIDEEIEDLDNAVAILGGLGNLRFRYYNK